MAKLLISKREELFKLVREIPKGRVVTYKSLAEQINSSPRAVGRMLNCNTQPVTIPCHRVIMSSGKVGGYKWKVKRKKELLISEGVKIEKDKVVI